MRAIIITLISFLAGFLQQDTPKLNGNYRIVFEKKYEQQTFKMEFRDSIFKKIMPDAVAYKGKIKYEKYRAFLRYGKEDNPIEIDNREFGKDSMKFVMRANSDLSKTTARGILVKIK
ncbi:hypothetical protein G4D82_07125 [Flavobacterium sp. CYK-4]|uniref:hypothetical protein n=1 Tax=Flavobacterium lotistagni TaxID=2709660 RepID=UPI00140B6E90|nr:hypothetical protein [Flavobacterium lotistagni]NHM06989.1 hypothetical protein [Flavobacterium lotistagni]